MTRLFTIESNTFRSIQGAFMQSGYAKTSLYLFGLSIILLIAMTAFESALVGTSQGTQRIITFLTLVLPAMAGLVFGIISVSRKEGRTALAVTGIILNTLFAIFHLLILSFAG
jgi:hypothetical protein